jgi:RNA recognition motif-containing protein
MICVPQTCNHTCWLHVCVDGPYALPAVNVYLPKDRVTNTHQGYGFVEFRSEEDADYAIKVLNMIKMYAKPIRVNKASQDKKTQDVGANLFIGNLDPDVDEKVGTGWVAAGMCCCFQCPCVPSNMLCTSLPALACLLRDMLCLSA